MHDTAPDKQELSSLSAALRTSVLMLFLYFPFLFSSWPLLASEIMILLGCDFFIVCCPAAPSSCGHKLQVGKGLSVMVTPAPTGQLDEGWSGSLEDPGSALTKVPSHVFTWS